MNLFRTSFFTSIVTAVKLLCNFMIAKMMAVYVGPIGFALVGQFMSFMQIMQTVAGAMFGPGVVKYIAEHRDSPEELNRVINIGFAINFIFSILVSMIVYILRFWLSHWIFHDVRYAWCFSLASVGTIFFVLNNFVISVLNGEGKIRQYALILLLNNVTAVILSVTLIYFFGVSGALFSVAINQSLVLIISIFFLRGSYAFCWQFCREGFVYLKGFLSFGLMATISSFLLPFAQLLIRDFLAKKLSWDEVGIWQGMIKISDAYLVFFTSILSVYFLPKFASLKEHFLIKREMNTGFLHFLPVHLLIVACIYFFRKDIILLLYSSKFLKIADILLYQLIGDIFKILSWIIGYLMWAKKMTRLLISTEIIFSISYCFILMWLVGWVGLIGTSIGFMLNYMIYFFTLYFLIYKKL